MHLRKKSLPVISLEETTQGTDEDSPRKDFGADDLALAGSIDRLQLQRAVDNLPPGYRTIFVLHDIEGYEHNEIAKIAGWSSGNRAWRKWKTAAASISAPISGVARRAPRWSENWI